MKIIKLEHSCLIVEQGDRVLVIDPGVYSDSFAPNDNIDAVIVTHEHSDHFDLAKIQLIQRENPNARIFTTPKVAAQIPGAEIAAGKIQNGAWQLEFFGHDHAPILDNVVPCENVGVVINNELVYPGDSFSMPPVQAKILALPVSAPWLKLGETVKYLAATKPEKIFPTHDVLLSQIGRDITYGLLRKTAAEIGAGFVDLQPGESLEI